MYVHFVIILEPKQIVQIGVLDFLSELTFSEMVPFCLILLKRKKHLFVEQTPYSRNTNPNIKLCDTIILIIRLIKTFQKVLYATNNFNININIIKFLIKGNFLGRCLVKILFTLFSFTFVIHIVYLTE